MNLYLMRHGIALDNANDDFHRPLTDKGASRVRNAAKGMRRLGLDFDALLSSPLLRARQTADVVADVLHQQDGVQELASLAPETPVEKLITDLTHLQNLASVLLVGHEPSLSNAVAHLIGEKSGAARLDFKKSGLCRVDIEPPLRAGSGTLRWLLTAKQLRLLGERRAK